MVNWNRMELLVRERQHELWREAARQRRIEAALVGRQAGRTPAWGLRAAQGRRMVFWLGQRLLTWGARVQTTTRY